MYIVCAPYVLYTVHVHCVQAGDGRVLTDSSLVSSRLSSSARWVSWVDFHFTVLIVHVQACRRVWVWVDAVGR